MMRKVIYLNLVIVSFIIMGLEMTATRFIAPTFGNTVYTWGIIITVFLIGSSIGYVLGGWIADQNEYLKILLVLYLVSMFFISFIPVVKDMFFPLLNSFSSEFGTSLGVILLYFIPNLLLSSIIPILMKVGLENEISGTIIGKLHSSSAIGSVLGTVVTTFWIIPYTNINSVISILVFILFIGFLAYFHKNKVGHRTMLLLPILIVIFPFYSANNIKPNVIYHSTSLYHDIYVYELNDEKNDSRYRYLTFGNKDTIQGKMNVNNPDQLVLNYSQDIWDLSNEYKDNSKNVFIVGHGIGSIVKKFETEGKKVKVAEIDKTVLEVSREYFQYNGNSVIIGDGRKILNDEKMKSDIIFLDAYNNTTQIPFHLVTKEFFKLTESKLKQDGVLLVNAIGKPKGDEFINSLYSTLGSVYPYVKIFGRLEQGQQNLYFLASNTPLKESEIERLRELRIAKGEVILDTDTKLKELN